MKLSFIPILLSFNSVLIAKKILFLSALLFLWSVTATILNNGSNESIVSSIRILLETIFVITAYKFFGNFFPKYLIQFLVSLAIVNSLVVCVQLLEGASYISTNLNWIPVEFWKLPVNEVSRKPGLFNGFQTSSLLSFFALAVLAKRKDLISVCAMVLCLMPIIFGARAFLIFLPLFFLFYWRVLLGGVLLLGLVLAVDQNHEVTRILRVHLENRILPIVMIILDTDLDQDYSVSDLASHYKLPVETVISDPQISNDNELPMWLIGNGAPRFSELGGKDPAVTRWAFQAGVPSVTLIMLITAFICLGIAAKGTWGNVVFALALAFSIFKTELVTSTLVYSFLVTYALTSRGSPTESTDNKHVFGNNMLRRTYPNERARMK